jgi:hypothetical protein
LLIVILSSIDIVLGGYHECHIGSSLTAWPPRERSSGVIESARRPFVVVQLLDLSDSTFMQEDRCIARLDHPHSLTLKGTP